MSDTATIDAATDDAAATELWQRALTAIAVFAVDPAGLGGIDVRAGVGPVRDVWLACLRDCAAGTTIRRMPAGIDDERLLGGLDLTATLARNMPVSAPGFLAEADGDIVLLAMAERLSSGTTAHLAAALDTGIVRSARDGIADISPARFGVVALDEGEDDERTPSALRDRLAISLDLRALSLRDIAADGVGHVCRTGMTLASTESMARDVNIACLSTTHVEAARKRLSRIAVDDAVVSACCTAAVALGVGSLRAPLHAIRVARCLAALGGRDAVSADDARMAAALVLAPRALQLPTSQEEQRADDPQDRAEPDAPSEQSLPSQDAQKLDDVVLDAAKAALPQALLARLAVDTRTPERGARDRGKVGARQAGAQHGRRIGARAGTPRGARLDIIATLRAAAPWQRLRSGDTAPGRIKIRRDDFRIMRFEQRTPTIAIFLVDASGSSARERLAEAKGAVRLMLADCYIRRDEVALLAFRGASADLLLPPTRSLVRAERALAALPGGGGTPLAAGLDAAVALGGAQARSGRTPTLVLMTDGRANVARDGAGGRPRAHADALDAARAWRAGGFAAAFLDTSASPGPLGAEIAAAMGARYVPLPFADARGVDAAARAITRSSRR